ncbi:reverse transcriptase family protein [Pseudohongiella sp.]|uniref:Reverse transcriptase domain-containing protein n=1 Tax=marine sediment metagenome TaxID=412755 RepID=A0A0F9YHQ7_9ZZZZ|nr:reverse transcriptase family protein [Pseudohongiella sp.]
MTDLRPEKITKSSIGSISKLSVVLSIPESDLSAILKILPENRYKKITIPKGVGGERIVYSATPLLRKIQHRINTRIFKKLIKWPPYLYGSLPNDKELVGGQTKTTVQRDYIACAQNHCGAKSILKLDIANFFENIHRDTVKKIFRKFFHYPENVSDYLTEVCCYGDTLVQGALTSSYLASLCMWDTEYKVIQKLSRRNLVYTRLVDDITISSKHRGYDFRNAESHVRAMMLKKDFPLNLSKTKIMRAGSSPLLVHGLIVNFRTPRLPSSEISRIKASVNNLVKASATDNYRTTYSFRAQYFRCLGRVNRLARVNHNKHEYLINKLKKIRPKPCKTDIERVENAIDRLKSLKDKTTDSYRRIYNIARYRIGIVSRSFDRKSMILLSELKKLEKPVSKID